MLLIASFLGLILLSVFLCRRNLTDIQEMTTSIYQDRLVPTATTMSLASAMYRKRQLLDHCAQADQKTSPAVLKWQIEDTNERVDSLIEAFAKTQLTTTEANHLRTFRQRLALYNRSERAFLASATQPTASSDSMAVAFRQLTDELNNLAALQVTVGEDLLDDAREKTRSTLVLTACQIGLILLIGGLIWQRSSLL